MSKETDQLAEETWYAVMRQSDRNKQIAIIKAAIEKGNQDWLRSTNFVTQAVEKAVEEDDEHH